MPPEIEPPEISGELPEPDGEPKHKGESNEIISDRTATVIISVVTSIWAANIIAGMFEVNDYQPSETINGIFMTIVGGAFVLRARSRGGD